MRLARIRLCNFRCFGPTPTTIEFDGVTAVLGANGSGKTAILEALARLFGVTQQARVLVSDDFHVANGERRDSVQERTLFIEAEFTFPPLERGADDPTVPPIFEQMSIKAGEGQLICRMRLSGTWTRSALAEGTVEMQAQWLCSAEDEPPDTDRRPVAPIDRDRVRVYYVPAARDAARHLSTGAGGMLQQLLQAVEWDESIREAVRKSGEDLGTEFARQPAVERLNVAYEKHWGSLYDEWLYQKPSLRLTARRIEDTIRSAQIVFNPTHGTSDHELNRLSEGQQSLFYFAFVSTLFDVQREAFDEEHREANDFDGSGHRKENGEGRRDAEAASARSAFAYHKLRPAALTIFAIEEPENHLAPHYLGRITSRLTGLVTGGRSQVVLASHAPSVLARIEPTSVRHVRCDPATHTSRIRRLTLPAGMSDAEKYVREAVRAFPELYFARGVVLCEGDSEEILLPRFARVLGHDIDLSLLSVVPLGGRHVNHFWRLLTDLQIPFVTLLDLDRERETGGWERVHYVLVQLLEFLDPVKRARLLEGPPLGNDALTDSAAIEQLKSRDPLDTTSLAAWTRHLRTFGVFFSEPLDVDFMMLEAFTEAYQSTAQGVPRVSSDQVRPRVLGERATGDSYSPVQRALFPWYSSLFLNRGKPSTHTAAWVTLSTATAAERIPEPLRELLVSLRSRVVQANEPHRPAVQFELPDSGPGVSDRTTLPPVSSVPPDFTLSSPQSAESVARQLE